MNLRFREDPKETQSELSAPSTRLPSETTTRSAKSGLKVHPKEAKKLNPKRKARRKKNLKFAGAAALVIMLGAAATGLWAVGSGEGALNAEIARARAAGCVVSPEQVNELLNVPPDQNAARAYEGAFSLHRAADRIAREQKLKPLPDGIPPFRQQILEGTIRPEDMALVRQTLQREQDSLAAFRSASEFPRLAFPRDYSIPALTIMPEYATMKVGARHLNLEAAVAIQEGNWAKAQADLVAAAHISRHLNEEPFLIAGLVQIAIGTETMQTCRTILQTRWQDPHAADLVDNVVKAWGGPAHFENMLRFEALGGVGLRALAQLYAAKDPRVFTGSDDQNAMDTMRPLLVPGLGAAIETNVIKSAREQMEAAHKFGDDYKGLGGALQTLSNSQDHGGWIDRLASPYSGIFVGSTAALADGAAYQRVLKQAVAAIRARRAQGAWPNQLPLSGIDAQDPHRNQPLKTRFGPGEFDAWSVGRDGIDQGGAYTFAVDGKRAADDIGIKLHG